MMEIDRAKIKKGLKKTEDNFIYSIPILIGVISLVALIITLIPPQIYGNYFSGNNLVDPLIGAALGSIFSGNPITSYIIGGELQSSGISAVAIVAFMIAWVTVGIIQAPAEIQIFNLKFTIIRNIFAFFSAIIIAILTVSILGW